MKVLVNKQNEIILMGSPVESGGAFPVAGKVAGGLLPTKKLTGGLVKVSHPEQDNMKWDYYLPSAFGLRWVDLDEWAKTQNEEHVAEVEHALGLMPYKLRTL